MPTLRRSRRKELTLTRSFVRAVQSKVWSSGQPAIPGFNLAELSSALPPSSIRTESPINHRQRRVHVLCDPLAAFPQVHFIHLLPQDILLQVFLVGAEEDALLPVTVSHVCGSWRDLARSPALWTRIALDQRVKLWKVYTARSKECTLDIQLLPRTSPWATKGGHVQQFDHRTVYHYMHAATPSIYRWRSLEIKFNQYTPFLWNAALSECCGTMVHAPRIGEVSLVYPENDDTKEFTLFGGSAPRLRRLTVVGLRLTWLATLFGNLVFLDYTHHNFTQGESAVASILAHLQVCSRLEELRLCLRHNKHYHSRQSVTRSAVTLPRLRRLEVSVEGSALPPEMMHIMGNLSTPNVTVLRLRHPTRAHRPFSHLEAFFHAYRMPGSLQSLHVENGWAYPGLLPFLPPKLRDFEVVETT